ncbi:MAG: GGDEF domain-containing protein [Candidatus Pacearchaeota archaeon]
MVLKRNIESLIKKLKHPHSMSKHEVWKLVDKLKVNIDSLHYIATHDEKTGLYNLNFFKQIFAIEAAQALRGKPLSIILIDLDFFKKINDDKGHIFADNLLKRFCIILSKKLRAYDTLARFGGDEFLILLPDTSLESAIMIAERLRDAINEDFVLLQSGLTASFGVSTFQARDNFSSLVERADKAMYKAKREGRNKVCF